MPNSNVDYLKKHKIDNGRVARRYRTTLEFLHNFVNTKKIALSVNVDGRILKTAILDYFVDIARIKEFHEIEKIDIDKIYSHMAYWLLKRKPIQIIKQFPGSEFINELFVTSYLISSILAEKSIDGKRTAQNATFNHFQSQLFYNLKYRQVSQKSLELMIDTFFCGCEL
jgi:hypothetical protein